MSMKVWRMRGSRNGDEKNKNNVPLVSGSGLIKRKECRVMQTASMQGQKAMTARVLLRDRWRVRKRGWKVRIRGYGTCAICGIGKKNAARECVGRWSGS